MFVYAASLVLLAFALSGCGTTPLARIAYMPPDEFLRPFNGTVVVMPQDPNSPNVSSAETKPTLGTCIIRLPAGHTVPGIAAPAAPTTMLFEPSVAPSQGAWRINDELRRGLFLIELGGCNGAIDVNADPQRRIVPAGYERTLASRDWTPVYERLAATAKWVGVAP